MHILYGYPHSANTYKVQLLFRQLDLDLEFIGIDILKGESHSPEFAKKNPFEMTPMLESKKDGRIYVESNAILWRFAKRTPLGLDSAEGEHEALKWMFYEQNLLEPNIGRARRLLHSDKRSPEEAGLPLVERQNAAVQALKLLDNAIGSRKFLVHDTYSIADIAVFAYVHVAPEGGISLDGFPNIGRWIENVRATPGFVELGSQS